jgi:hypothetical protein
MLRPSAIGHPTASRTVLISHLGVKVYSISSRASHKRFDLIGAALGQKDQVRPRARPQLSSYRPPRCAGLRCAETHQVRTVTDV